MPKDTDVVINVAGQNVLDPMSRWTEAFKKQVVDSRVGTTKTSAEAIKKSANPPKVFITMSGVGFYPPSKTVEYTEDSKPKPTDYFSKLCQSWEDAGNLPDSCPTRRVIIRCGVVLGKDGGMILNVRTPFLLGFGGNISTGEQFFPWIHITDLVNLFVFAAKEDKVRGVLNAVAPEITTNKEFTTKYAEVLSRPTSFALPKFALDLLLGKDRATMITEGQMVKPKRVLEYGFNYTFSSLTNALYDIESK